MKKIVSLFVIAALLLGMCGITVFAADGDQPTPTKGPATSTFMYGGARCGIYDTQTNKTKYVICYDYDAGGLAVYNDDIPGMTYDMESNTVTINGVHQPGNELFIWYMGNDFKLNVEGENEFGIIYVYNYFNFHSTSLNIIGTGTLTVNEQQINKDAIHMYADGVDPLMALDIADSVTVHLYSKTGEEQTSPVISLNRSAITPAEGGAITVGGKAITGVKNEQFKTTDFDYVPVIEVEDLDEEQSNGYQVRSASDPDGVYTVGIMDGIYIVRRWIYVESLGVWIRDRDFADLGYVGKRYTKEEFETEYEYVLGIAPLYIEYMSDYAYRTRGSKGAKMTKDGEPDALYVGLPTSASWDWSYDENYTGNYEISRVVWNESQGIYVADTSFSLIDLMAGELEENGYHIVTEDVFEQTKLTVWTGEDASVSPYFDIDAPAMLRKSDPDNLYVKIGTYGSGGGDNGILVYKVHYNPELERHYVEYQSYSEPECYFVSNASIEDGTADFAYEGETVTKHVGQEFLPADYNIRSDLTSAAQVRKIGDPDTVYAYRSWTHYMENNTRRTEYGLMRMQYNEGLGVYVEDDSFDEIVFYDTADLEDMGYEIVTADGQKLEFVTKGSAYFSEYPAYTSADGGAYYADYSDSVYSYSEDGVVTIGSYTYYRGTYEPDLSTDDLISSEHEIVTDTYRYWVDAPEYHHVASEPAGYTLSGKLTTFLDPNEYVRISLQSSEGLQINYLAEGSDKSYSIPNVLPGKYTMTVSKKNHATRTYEVTVSGDTTQNVKIHALGDIDGDGKCNAKDYGMASAHAQKVTFLTGYQLACGDVVKHDGKITAPDAARIGSHAQKVDLMW